MLAIIWYCNQSTDKEQIKNQSTKKEAKSQVNEIPEATILNYQDFEIQKGQLGEIKIGMTISEAEQKFSGLRKETDQATNFGYGGGSPAYLYYEGKTIIFGLIPTLNTNTILFIIVVSKKLTTTNGLSPNSTVKEISEK